MNLFGMSFFQEGFDNLYSIAYRRHPAPSAQAFVLNDHFFVADGFDWESLLSLGKPERSESGTHLYQALHLGDLLGISWESLERLSAWCLSADECLMATVYTVASSEKNRIRRNARIFRLAQYRLELPEQVNF